MTRFARIGLKGSDDKKAEESTPWVEMKTAMLEKQKQTDDDKAVRVQNNCEIDVPSTEEIQSVWAELTTTRGKKKNTEFAVKSRGSFKGSKVINDERLEDAKLLKKVKKGKLALDSENVRLRKMKKDEGFAVKNKGSGSKLINDDRLEDAKLQKEVKKRKLALDSENENLKKNKLTSDSKSGNSKKIKVKLVPNFLENPQDTIVKRKRKAENNEKSLMEVKKQKKLPEVIFEGADSNVLPKKKVMKFQIRQLTDDTTNVDAKLDLNVDKSVSNSSIDQLNIGEDIKMTSSPVEGSQSLRKKGRRKPELQSSTVIINGRQVKISPFDGFMVQNDDAVRLAELRKSMIAKRVPIEERERAMKLERRRAEKALSRLKKQVCFHCRQSGHNLSDCPQIAEDHRSSGICYKCGSTEHTHFQCRVTRAQEFRFAECFICKEQGHIAKQCPDNPRGLYPRGGACAACGDVTHLKKDCPKYLAEKEEDTVTVGKRNDRILEALDEEFVPKTEPIIAKKKNKHIKF